ncbi:uncharacterized protein LOC144115801 isoform X1 [Amblyomma americanum]
MASGILGVHVHGCYTCLLFCLFFREKGGAYGVGVAVRPAGCLSFYSYRDPNMEKTLDVFCDSVAWLTRGEFTEEDLEEAKLACFARVDKPITPGDCGAAAFLHGITDEMKQEHRQRLFSSTKDDVIAAVKRCASEGGCTSSVAVIGPENKFTETGRHWLVHRDGSNKPGEDLEDGKEAGQVAEESAAHAQKKDSSSKGDSSSSSSGSDSDTSDSDRDSSADRFLLKIHDLPENITAEQVARHLKQAGVRVSGGRLGILLLTRSKGDLPIGRAFVEVASKEDQERALSYAWESAKLSGHRIKAFRGQVDDVRRYVMSRRPALSALHKGVTSSCVVQVRNLPVGATEEKLKELFSHCKVTQVEREKFNSGRAQRAAFMRFMCPDEAQRALAVNGRKLMGQKLELCLVPEDYADRLLEGDLLNLASYAEQKGSRIGTRRVSGTARRAAKEASLREGATNFRLAEPHELEAILQTSEGQHRVVAEGLPFSIAQIENFLWPAKPSLVVRVRRASGVMSGKVVITFASLADAQETAKKNGHMIFGRSVRIKLLMPGTPSGEENDSVTADVATASSPSSS